MSLNGRVRRRSHLVPGQGAWLRYWLGTNVNTRYFQVPTVESGHGCVPVPSTRSGASTFLCRYPGTGSWIPSVDSPLALFLKVRETILHPRHKKKLATWDLESLKKQHLFHNLPNFYNPALEVSFYNFIW